MLKAVIFDMDGVISDTEPGYKITTIQFMKEHGIDVPKEYLMKLTGTPALTVWEQLQEDFDFHLYPAQECVDRVDQMRVELMEREGLHPLPGVIDLVKRLYDAGITLAVASSNTDEQIERNIQAFGIEDYFTALAGGADLPHGKPEPDVFLKALDMLGLPAEECIVIEDSCNGLRAAHSAGMKAIGFDNPEFHQDGIGEIADLVISAFDDLSVEMCKELNN